MSFMLKKSYRGHMWMWLLPFLVIASLPAQSFAQLAKGRTKWVGNILDAGAIPSNFTQFWNQVTPENAGKWGSIQGTDTSGFTWTGIEQIYDYAISHNFPFKYHNLIWGAQQPTFMTDDSLDSTQEYRAISVWIDSVGHKFPKSAMVDVVNEPIHTPPAYKQALGGDGATGWDWVIKAFELAKQAFPPTTKLLLNEYGVVSSQSTTATYLKIIRLLQAKGLIDGIGVQAHTFSIVNAQLSVMKANLDSLATTGLPIYVSEMDISESSDQVQLQKYESIFPLFYQFPDVKGITLWGYIQYQIWQTNAYLLTSRLAERPAMQWLQTYFANFLKTELASPVDTTVSRNPLLAWHPSEAATNYYVEVATDSSFSSVIYDSTVTDTTVRMSPLAAGSEFYWHVMAYNSDDSGSYSSTAHFTTGDTVTAIKGLKQIPTGFALAQNYPNPFNPTTQIDYTIAKRSYVTLKVYNVLGEEVATLASGEEEPGGYTATFDASKLPSGVYFYRLTAGRYTAVKKLMLVK